MQTSWPACIHIAGVAVRVADARSLPCAGLQELAGMSHLTRLDLSVCREVTDAGVANLSTLTSLASLDLTFIDKVTHAGVASLTR